MDALFGSAESLFLDLLQSLVLGSFHCRLPSKIRLKHHAQGLPSRRGDRNAFASLNMSPCGHNREPWGRAVMIIEASLLIRTLKSKRLQIHDGNVAFRCRVWGLRAQ